MPENDKTIIRDLASRYAELANDPKCKEREIRIRNTNSLRPCRPIVWIEELPWHELNFDGSLDLHCKGDFAREIELFFRKTLFKWEHFQADMLVEDCYYIQKAYSVTNIGVNISEETIAIDETRHVVSHSYEDVLDTEEKLDALKAPIVTANPQLDKERIAAAEDLLDGLIPVRLRGDQIYHSPWDIISQLRGVEPILMDLIERPEFMHKTVSIFSKFAKSQYKQMEAAGLLESNLIDIHATPAYCDELVHDENSGVTKLKDVWFRGMAQIFGSVSPSMHQEFDLDYMSPIMEMCGQVYYGCCEPLDRKIELLKKIPNMRKIGVSPWADVNICAEQIAGDYVLSHKPNPAFVSGKFNEQTIRGEIEKVIEASLNYGCPCDIVLKDVSTVSYNVSNLKNWNKLVQETIDKYYG